MTDTGRRLAAACLKMLNEHEPYLVDTFVARDYRNHNAFVDDGRARQADRAVWPARGGVAGSAGGTGAGGVAGDAGSTALAGAGSAGLTGAGGVAGSGGCAGSFGADGGVPVDAAVTCDDLHNQYAANLLVARRCTVDASGQCTQLVDSSFPQVICGPSGGQTYVNDASALGPAWSEALALHCSIAVKCGGGSSDSAIPDGGVCVATDGGSGLCSLLLPVT